MTREFRVLLVQITENERQDRARACVEATHRRAELDDGHRRALDAAKAAAKDREAQIAAEAAEASRLAGIVRTGYEPREVECTWELEGDNMVCTRLDTGEVVTTRPATERDRQVEITIATRAEARAELDAAKPRRSKLDAADDAEIRQAERNVTGLVLDALSGNASSLIEGVDAPAARTPRRSPRRGGGAS